MRKLRPVLLLFTFLLIPSALNAQQVSTSAPRDPQSLTLLQRSLAALVGTSTVNDVTLTGNARRIAGSEDESGTATLNATATGQGRMDLNLPAGQRSEVVDISQAVPAGKWCGMDGVWHPMAAHNLFADPTWFFPTFLINRVLSGANYAISPMDAETQDGVAVEHLQMYQQASSTPELVALTQTLSQIDIYLNPSTLLPVRIMYNAHADNNALVNIPVRIEFSDYQTVQGTLIPYHIQKYIQNGLALDVTVTNAQVNPSVAASRNSKLNRSTARK